MTWNIYEHDMVERGRKERNYLQTLVDYHRKQWYWVANETRKQGRKILPKEYLEQLSGDDYKTVHSIIKEISPEENDGWFACCYYKHKYGTCNMSSSDCVDNCPFEWDGEGNFRAVCWGHDSSYKKWKETKNLEDCAKFAERIARLPVATGRAGIHYHV